MALTSMTNVRETTSDFTIEFRDSDGVAIDITGYEVWFTVRKDIPQTKIRDDTDAIISKTYTNGGAAGDINVSLTSDDTNIEPRTYKYDVQYKKTDASIHSSGSNDFIITGDITRDT